MSKHQVYSLVSFILNDVDSFATEWSAHWPRFLIFIFDFFI
jgi:hypothetical protein